MARDASGVIAGVGLLYMAPLATAAPSTKAGVPGTGWTEIGYTDAGSTINTAVSSEDLEVAEELAPIGTTTTKRTGSVSFAMAQATADHLALALNLGVFTTPTDAGLQSGIVPPDPANELYIKLALKTNQGALWYFPKVKNTAEFSLARAKTGKTLISVEMGIFQDTGAPFFKVFPATDGSI